MTSSRLNSLLNTPYLDDYLFKYTGSSIIIQRGKYNQPDEYPINHLISKLQENTLYSAVEVVSLICDPTGKVIKYEDVVWEQIFDILNHPMDSVLIFDKDYLKISNNKITVIRPKNYIDLIPSSMISRCEEILFKGLHDNLKKIYISFIASLNKNSPIKLYYTNECVKEFQKINKSPTTLDQKLYQFMDILNQMPNSSSLFVKFRNKYEFIIKEYLLTKNLSKFIISMESLIIKLNKIFELN